ncbi:MAG: glycoside hydrolase TIM-barrel-like domain-containing protein, partial [Pseudomonadota bacterium]
SFAVALAEGPIERIGRVWADGKPMDLEGVSWRLHRGGRQQGPDPAIEAAEGEAPAFRGVAYIVFEDLPVGPFGNRVPQISVEVMRQPRIPDALDLQEEDLSLRSVVKAVAMSPGSGEFAYETEPVRAIEAEGRERWVNLNSSQSLADAVVSLDQLEGDLPACKSVSLVVSWFGNDLRADRCKLRPGAEFVTTVTEPHVWVVGGETRETSYLVGRDGEDRPVYGGTPSDGSIIRYIRELKARGIRVMFYPFILMDIPPDTERNNPWPWSEKQPPYPWRGRITTSKAPGVVGSPDQTAAAADEVDAFFGEAGPGDFLPGGETVGYAGPNEWGMRRFILHYAHLCALAGGVDAFCIGSEMRGLTQIRSARTSYPAVEAFRKLARDVREVVGTSTKIGYAADWSEYFGHQPQDGSGDRFFHLDPLWGDRAIDFVGIDWYAPHTDWRDGADHLDAQETGSIYDLDFLADRFASGEGYDWFYADDAARRDQTRSPITDGAYNEPWVYRFKDLENWWSKPHHDRVGGSRSFVRTDWRPRSKPIWLTEIGCGAVDKASNQPNIFVDPKSSENGLPHFSTGAQDLLIQRRYLQAAAKHWRPRSRNPESDRYDGRMLDLANAYAWTWDARPWPDFPKRLDVWSDGGNHDLGHWLTGRATSASLDAVVAEICREAGIDDFDVSGLHGLIDGFVQPRTQSPREALQSLMLAYGFDAFESAGTLRFVMRSVGRSVEIAEDDLISTDAAEGREVEFTRADEGEALATVRVGYQRGEADYQAGTAEANNPFAEAQGVQGADLPLAMTRNQAAEIAERWAMESETARETASFVASPNLLSLEPGDLVRFGPAGSAEYRVERIADGIARRVEATRAEPALHRGGARTRVLEQNAPEVVRSRPGQPGYRLLDVPWSVLGPLAGATYAAAWATPWPGSVALFSSETEEGFLAVDRTRRPATVARLLGPLRAARPFLWSRDEGVEVEVLSGAFSSVSEEAALNGGNLAALASPNGGWELLRFQQAELIEERRYRLSRMLRGFGGTEPLIGDPTPEGSVLVLLDESLLRFELGADQIGLERRYRIGPGTLPLSDPSYAEARWTYGGARFRPFAPTRLAAARAASGNVEVSWVRRGRGDDDFWRAGELPLFEASERYRVRVFDGSALLRETETTAPAFTWTAAMQAADGASGPVRLSVAQISAEYGPGFDGEVTFDG